MTDKAEIIRILKEGVCEVTFTKVNGEQRVMPCTLKESLLPHKKAEDTKRSSNRTRQDNDVVSVWCVDASGWRSFKLSNFISINPLHEYKT